MEIEEFLTRIDIRTDAKKETPTIFRISERSVLDEFSKDSKGDLRGIWSHLTTQDRSVTVVGFSKYDKPFPENVFAIPTKDLRNVLLETNKIEIEESYLHASGDMDFRLKLEVMEKGKALRLQYDNPLIALSKETIQKIIKIDSILDSTSVFIDISEGFATITLKNKNGNSGHVKIPSDFPEYHARFEERFMECIKLIGNNDATLNLDGYDPNRDHKAHGLARLEIRDNDSIISYYIKEVTQKVQDDRKRKPKETEPKEKDSNSAIDDFDESGDGN